jgi:hypothetical protein
MDVSIDTVAVSTVIVRFYLSRVVHPSSAFNIMPPSPICNTPAAILGFGANCAELHTTKSLHMERPAPPLGHSVA